MPVFTCAGAEPSVIPVLIAVPHAGRAYDDALLAQMRHPGSSCLRLEDRYADRLAQAVAEATGASLLVANAPRAMIDLNRAPDDIDWGMVRMAGGMRPPAGRADGRARSGLGLVPRRLPGVGEIWKQPLDGGELAERIARIHQPYHACLAATLAAMRARWGSVLLIDLHSMPPLPPRAGQPAPHFVLGDRFGASCDGRLVAAAFTAFELGRRPAAHNRPYSGGYVLARHGAPARGIHAMQLEIDRRAYLDSRLVEPGEGMAAMIADLVMLVHRLADEAVALGSRGSARNGRDSRWAEAAE